jgi:competence protein ComEC
VGAGLAEVQGRSTAFARPAWLDASLAAQAPNLLLWVPVLFGLGIGLAFAVGDPKLRWALLAVLAAASALAMLLRARLLAPALLLVLSGLSWTQLRATWQATPTLAAPLERALITGRLVRLDRVSESQVRLRLADVWVDGQQLRAVRLLAPIRLGNEPPIGATLALQARLAPPPGPATPRGYDFARAAWFDDLGAVGAALRPPQLLAQPPPTLLSERMAAARAAASARIRAAVPGPPGEILVAMVVGDGAALSDAQADALRTAGLQHLLSISGFHLAVVAGSVFWLLRKALSLWPALALRVRTKAIAAVVAALVAVAYTLFTGGAWPTWRSCLSVLVVAAAVLLHRRPFSLRLVAAAAMIILIWQPAALINVSFQLSFAAVTALITLAEPGGPMARLSSRLGDGWTGRALLWVAGLVLTTLAAEAALAPLLIYHFHQVGLFGLVANSLAIPLSSVLILPVGLLGLAQNLFGLGDQLLQVAGWASAQLLDIATTVAGWPHSVLRVPMIPLSSALAAVLAGLCLCLGLGRVRLLCIPLLGLAAGLAVASPAPDLRLSSSGRLVAIPAGEAVAVNDLRGARFTRERWRQDAGQALDWSWAELGLLDPSSAECGRSRCVAVFRANGRQWVIAVDGRQAPRHCPDADIWISPARAVAGSCPLLTFDRPWFAREGATDVWLGSGQIETVRQVSGQQPWTRLATPAAAP